MRKCESEKSEKGEDVKRKMQRLENVKENIKWEKGQGRTYEI